MPQRFIILYRHQHFHRHPQPEAPAPSLPHRSPVTGARWQMPSRGRCCSRSRLSIHRTRFASDLRPLPPLTLLPITTPSPAPLSIRNPIPTPPQALAPGCTPHPHPTLQFCGRGALADTTKGVLLRRKLPQPSLCSCTPIPTPFSAPVFTPLSVPPSRPLPQPSSSSSSSPLLQMHRSTVL